MAILTQSGRVALAIAVMAQPIHLAWGAGNPAWDTVPEVEPPSASALVAEIGRHAISEAQYVIPDPQGTIVVPVAEDEVQRFSVSVTPTNYIFMRFNYGYGDAPDATIREVGIFVGTQLKAGLPPGQVYFEGDDITAPGTLLMLERFSKFTRSVASRQAFEFVVMI